MPELDGESVLKELSRLRPELPVILSTGDAQGFAGVDPETPGTYWLPKPYRADALQKVAALAISRGRVDLE